MFRSVAVLLMFAVGACAQQGQLARPAAIATQAQTVGHSAANYYLSTDLLPLRNRNVTGIHYADAASAYGTLRLAQRTGDKNLINRVEQRHARVLASGIVNTANHVDVSVYGTWPLYLARIRNDPAALAEGLRLADNQWAQTTPDGLTSQARYWIDDIWMISALQLQAWRATRDRKYLDRSALMARLYVQKLQQPNGLFFHGPDAPFFWARGNGWVAAGLAEILSDLPKAHRDYPVIATAYRKMMAGLLRYQADDGMWRQLIDYPDAWKETSGTAMFGYAMALGVHNRLLDSRTYGPAYRKAWTALATYVGPDGALREICIGTGQSKDPAYYLARPRKTGDLHGQAALLWFASEMARR
jgi:rhamnogalacturonyl hydrolase YesR